MLYNHKKTGKNFEIGRLNDYDGKTYDINVITIWDEENDYEKDPVLVGYYFGDRDNDNNDYFIEMFLKQQETLKKSIEYLKGKLLVDGDFMDPDEKEELEKTIDSLSLMITDLI